MTTIKKLIEAALLPDPKKEPSLFQDLEQSLKEAKAISKGQASASRRFLVVDEAYMELTPRQKDILERIKQQSLLIKRTTS